MSEEGEKLVRVLYHPNWTTFSRNASNNYNSPRVVLYINIRLLQLHFSLRNDIFDHRDILCIFFFNCSSIYFLVNIYSDLSQTALKYLNNTKANINSILIMIGDFNIRDSSWNSNFPHHSIYSDLTDIVDSMNLCMLRSTNQVPTRYSDNKNDSNSVIDLMFLRLDSSELDNHMIYLK